MPSVVNYNRYLPQTDGNTIQRSVITIDIRIQAAKQIRKLRQKDNWTQQKLSERCNFPGPWTVSRLETRGTDSLSTLQIICVAFGIEVWELLRDASCEPDQPDEDEK